MAFGSQVNLVVNLPRSGRPLLEERERRLIQEVIQEPTTTKELQTSLASIKVSVYDE